ncbi:MAG: class I SAM-dependent RNA methyltransferase [Proteobacteria bacterium]|nr:class I SAM-dependent RNA methyltransferase [Pseudomonadota bacterium]MBU1715864.1 class I SAM-dependent RNA methyltransferase [Pseudomonadota bacterium]
MNTSKKSAVFTYQKTNRFFAQISEGLEILGAEELKSLGATEIKTIYRGIWFEADMETLYRVNYQSRLCSRIMAQLLRFDCHSTKYLHKTAIKMDWLTLFDENKTFAISATVANSKIKHSQYAALCLKDAIADYFRELRGTRPNVDTENPDVRLNLHIENNRATINLDTSGGSLHRRGYRVESVEAPMQETVAAAIIRLSGWDGSTPLIDPMCGSGTLISEAIMHYCRIPAGYFRQQFGFTVMPEFDQKIWEKVRETENKQIKKLPAELVSANDINKQSVTAAQTNINLLPDSRQVRFTTKPFQQLKIKPKSTIICNPPYGIRLNKNTDIGSFMKELGDFLKTSCQGSTAYIYLGKKELAKEIGLKPAWKKPLKNGGLDGILVKYELY